ncbi:hypothetical protein GCM10010470_38280 [Saccharopolyspora taberi]|uniref:Uncharacterized protein n=1 Tax=Saccharopolyspora taberi TaxID=60895 RepID=A0ABN3VGB9_9PSEU
MLGVFAALVSALMLTASIVSVGVFEPFLLSIVLVAVRLAVFTVGAVLILGPKSQAGRYLIIIAAAAYLILGLWGAVTFLSVIGADGLTIGYVLPTLVNLLLLALVLLLAALPSTGRYLAAAAQRKRAATQQQWAQQQSPPQQWPQQPSPQQQWPQQR